MLLLGVAEAIMSSYLVLELIWLTAQGIVRGTRRQIEYFTRGRNVFWFLYLFYHLLLIWKWGTNLTVYDWYEISYERVFRG